MGYAQRQCAQSCCMVQRPDHWRQKIFGGCRCSITVVFEVLVRFCGNIKLATQAMGFGSVGNVRLADWGARDLSHLLTRNTEWYGIASYSKASCTLSLPLFYLRDTLTTYSPLNSSTIKQNNKRMKNKRTETPPYCNTSLPCRREICSNKLIIRSNISPTKLEDIVVRRIGNAGTTASELGGRASIIWVSTLQLRFFNSIRCSSGDSRISRTQLTKSWTFRLSRFSSKSINKIWMQKNGKTHDKLMQSKQTTPIK